MTCARARGGAAWSTGSNALSGTYHAHLYEVVERALADGKRPRVRPGDDALVQRSPILVVPARHRRQHELTAEGRRERERRAQLAQLEIDEGDVAFDGHTARWVGHRMRHLEREAE